MSKTLPKAEARALLRQVEAVPQNEVVKDRQYLDVCAKRCDQCLFSKGRIVSEERAQEIVDKINADGVSGHFQCHKHSLAKRDVMCRSDYDRDPERTLVMRMAQGLGRVRFINPDGSVAEITGHKERARRWVRVGQDEEPHDDER